MNLSPNLPELELMNPGPQPERGGSQLEPLTRFVNMPAGETTLTSGRPTIHINERSEFMRAMILDRPGQPLREAYIPKPHPSESQVLVRISACAICRTDLHIIDGELPHPKLPLVPGHEIVGRVEAYGLKVSRFQIGQRVGIPWLGWTCGQCNYCLSERENLCEKALFTGYTLDGGFAEYVVADARYCFALPSYFSDQELAPLLCAGLIGYRCLRKAGRGRHLGLYGFGVAAHLVAQIARHEGRKVYAFTRPGDTKGQTFAKSIGVAWVGDSTERPPEPLDAAIIFAPVGNLVPAALAATARGGCVVCGGIHMSDIPSFPYDVLWQERTLSSVANLTRRDGEEFLALAPRIPIHTTFQTFPLAKANEALGRLRDGTVTGAAVLVMN